MKPAQTRIQNLLNELVQGDREQGLQVAAYHRGELIVDAWAGFANPATGEEVNGRTLFPVFSVSKGITATLIHLAAERGQLDYETRIADYWPEFGVNGKETITLRQTLNHTSAIPQMPPATYGDLADWEKMAGLIAELRPVCEPGTRVEYHAITSGWIWGEILRRVDGRDFQTMLREEICAPLEIDDLFMGIPDDVEDRVAILEEIGEPWQPAVERPAYQSIPDWLQPLYEMMNRPDARRACIPATSGIMTARALARHYAALLPGGVDGVELLPPSRIAAAIQPVSLGYQIGGENSTLGGVTAFGHNGHGGPAGFADPERQLAFGFARNRLRGPNHPETARLIVEEIRKAL